MPPEALERRDCDAFAIRVTGDWPASPNDRHALFSVMISLAKRGEPSRHGADPRDLGYPELIVCAAGWLAQIIGAAGDEGYVVRVDIARREARHSPWPRWVFSREQGDALLESLNHARREAPDGRPVYPVLFWVLPHGRADLEERIDAFRKAPHDGALFEELLAGGVIRFSLSDAYLDILADPYLGNRVLGWLRAAAETTAGVNVEWNVLPAF